jgi:hypothetical protein
MMDGSTALILPPLKKRDEMVCVGMVELRDGKGNWYDVTLVPVARYYVEGKQQGWMMLQARPGSRQVQYTRVICDRISGKSEGKRPLRKSTRRLDVSIKVDPRGMWCGLTK